MDHAFLGGTGVKVSRLALGTMTFGGDADLDASRAIYRRAREAGVDHIDTADVYNKGRTEEIVGELTAGERDAIVLATKAYFPSGAKIFVHLDDPGIDAKIDSFDVGEALGGAWLELDGSGALLRVQKGGKLAPGTIVARVGDEVRVFVAGRDASRDRWVLLPEA